MRRLPVYVSREGGKLPITAVLSGISKNTVFIGTLHPFPVGSRVEIAATSRHRRFSLRGLVVQRTVAPAHPDNTRGAGMAVQVAMSREQQLALESKRRPMQRADLTVPAFAFAGTTKHELTFRNISRSGAALTTTAEIAQTQLLLLTFEFPGSTKRMAINAIVVRKESLRKESVLGIDFVDPPDQAVSTIEQYVSGGRS